jgi:EAL domain-containing protein (putative c-di-GMP-specific phosphodiesterase class I)
MVGLAHDFDVTAVAEGVEDETTLARLAELGCDQAQGYYFSRPVSLEALVQWFEAPSLAAATENGAQPVGAA